MSDGIHPSGPAQPSLDQAYQSKGNPATKEPAEQSQANTEDQSNPTDQRIPTKQTTSIDEATPSSLGRGVRGAGPGEEAQGRTHEQMGRNQELDADQMAAPGEGRVADAVDKHPGASGKEPGLETDLDRKKAEQAPAREAMKEKKQEEFDAGGVLGQRGGPANPVDKGNYPNSDKV